MPLTQQPKKKIATVPMLFKSIPKVLRDHFKAHCALRGRTMREVFIEFMEEKIQERQK